MATATGRPSSILPFATVTANTADAIFSNRNFTVKFETTSSYDYGLHDFDVVFEL